MNDLIALSDDERKLLTAFRKGERLVRARIMIAASSSDIDPAVDDISLLEFFATYMDCNEIGRARCVEAAEVFASAPSIEDAQARLAQLEEGTRRCNVIDIATARET